MVERPKQMAGEIFLSARRFSDAAGFAEWSAVVDRTGLSRDHRLRQHNLVRIPSRGASVGGQTVGYRTEPGPHQRLRRWKRPVRIFLSGSLLHDLHPDRKG